MSLPDPAERRTEGYRKTLPITRMRLALFNTPYSVRKVDAETWEITKDGMLGSYASVSRILDYGLIFELYKKDELLHDIAFKFGADVIDEKVNGKIHLANGTIKNLTDPEPRFFGTQD